MPEPTGHNLVRTSGGAMVHRAECRFVRKRGHPWPWAEGRPLRDWTSIPWLHACRVCRPDLPREDDGDA